MPAHFRPGAQIGLLGFAGDDAVCGGSGYEDVRGAPDENRLFAGDGNDTSTGGHDISQPTGGPGAGNLSGDLDEGGALI